MKSNQENISTCARLQTIQKDGYTTFAPIKVRYGEEKANISVYLQKICGGSAKINSHAKDKHNNLLGKYDYLIDNQDRTINYGYIETSHSNRRRGIGEILRLTSLIMLKENNLNTIKLEAFSEAIPFHIKYKFSPDLELKKPLNQFFLKLNITLLSVILFEKKQNDYLLKLYPTTFF